MKIGLCAKLDQAVRVKALGFDYLEASNVEIGTMTPEAFAAALALVRETGLPVLRCNCLFPGEIQLMTDGMDRIAAWLQMTLDRARQLGAEVMVFGAGRSRTRPERMPYGTALRRLMQVARLAGDCAAARGLRIAMEPLNAGETNMLLSMAEGAAFTAAVDHPAVGLLADYFHIAEMEEPVDDLRRLQPLWHVHLAAREGRRWPVEPEVGLVRFLGALRETGYDGCLSVEANSSDWEADAPRTLALIRQLMA